MRVHLERGASSDEPGAMIVIKHRQAMILCAALAAVSACRKRRNPDAQNGNANANGSANGTANANGAAGSTGAGTPSVPGVSGQQGQSSVESVPPTPATGCPAQQPNSALGPGTVHTSVISTNETWTLEGSPHRFPSGAHIGENVTVTVAPCAVVLVGDGQSLRVESGGAIMAVGEAARPIRFGSNKNEPQAGDWEGVIFEQQARRSSRIAHATIEFGGEETGNSTAGCLTTEMEGLDVQNVVLRMCRGFGLVAGGNGTLSSTSTAVTVREGTVSGREHAGSVYFSSPNAVRTLPEGTYTGNEVNEVYIDGDAVIATTGTWRNPGVRYHVANDRDLRVEGPTTPVLTIAPGTTVAFGSGSSLSIGWDAEGALVADGGAEAGRITFTGAASEPDPGAWEGIYIGSRALRSRTKLNWVSISFAGGDTTYEPPCSWNASENDAALYLVTALPAESVAHVTFTGLPENTAAIVRAWSNAPAINYGAAALANNFGASTACKQSPVRGNDGCAENARCD